MRRAAKMRAARNTTMPMNSRYSRPFATTPTIPSTIATITSSRKKAIIESSAPFGCSAAGQLPLTTSTRLVCEAVVLIDRLFVAHRQLAIGPDRGRVLDLPLVVGDLDVARTHCRLIKRYEHEPVPGRHSDLDRAERWQ